VLDSGAFIAAQSCEPSLMAFIKAAEKTDSPLFVSTAVIAEVWRNPPPANSAKLLIQATAVPLDITRSQRARELLGLSGTRQVVNSAVAALAIELRPSLVLTSDVSDIARLVRAGGFSCNRRSLRTSHVIVDLV